MSFKKPKGLLYLRGYLKSETSRNHFRSEDVVQVRNRLPSRESDGEKMKKRQGAETEVEIKRGGREQVSKNQTDLSESTGLTTCLPASRYATGWGSLRTVSNLR